MLDLENLQRMMGDAVQSRTDDQHLLRLINGHGLSASQRLQIHQNNYALQLEDALAATFPAIHGAVGAEFFHFMVTRFVKLHPPTHATLATYGGAFPTYIGSVEEAKGLPWLADLAQLEWARAQVLTGSEALVVHSPHPIDRLWQGMQDPPLIDPASIDLTDGPVAILVSIDDGTLYFTRLDHTQFH